MASVREVFEVAQAAEAWRRDRLAKLLPGATSLDPTPDYVHKEQVLWCEPVFGRDRFYCHDDKARLRWRVTPNQGFSPTSFGFIMGLPPWILRPKNRCITHRRTIHKMPENAL